MFLLHLFAYWATGREVSHDLLILCDSLLRDLCVAAFVMLLVKHRHGRPFSDLGVRSEKFFSYVRLGVLGYIAVVPLLALSFILLALITGLFH